MRQVPAIRLATSTWRLRTPRRRLKAAMSAVAVMTLLAAVAPASAAIPHTGPPVPAKIPNPCVTPPVGMVVWYPLDELAGATVVTDIAPPPGSLVNNLGVAQAGPVGPPAPSSGPWPVPGNVGGAHYFYPGNLHSVAPHTELDFGTGDFSIDAWIRIVSNTGVLQPIVDKLDIPGGNVGFVLYVQSQLLKLDMNGTTFASTVAMTGGSPVANTGPWYHIAATVSRATGAGILYVNGVPGPAFVPPATTVTNLLPMWIGDSRLPNVAGEIAIDELEIFNRALSAQEVMDLYAAGPAGKCKPGRADLGDAPDSTNHAGTTMSTYATANFPTVYDPPTPGPAGPRHDDARGLLWLGADVSLEHDADVGIDQDPLNNLMTSASPPTADHDGKDDGITTVPLPDCALTQFPITASNAAATVTQGYVNVWFDWTRDGDWDDTLRCAVSPSVTGLANEWAVQNQAVTLPVGTTPFSFNSDPFRSHNPGPGSPIWMRITLTSAPINATSHGGPFFSPADLGRGGSGPVGGYPFGETEDYLLDPVAGIAELCVYKYHDLNGDGVQQSGEPGLPGWQFNVLDAGGNIVTTVITGAQGWICFALPGPAPYTVTEVVQTGWIPTNPASGSVAVGITPGQLVNLIFGNFRKPIVDPPPPPVAATTGVVDVTQGVWHLRNTAGVVTSFYYGNPGDLPISGDWDGNGTSTPGLYRQSDGFFYARNSNTAGPADASCFAGDPADIPVVGDWDGDGDDNLGIYRPSEQKFYLFTITCTGTPMGAAQISVAFGDPGDKPVAGDWDGDGIDEVGLHRDSTGFFYWRNTLDTGVASGKIFFGDPGDRFVSGDWGTVDGIDTPAVFRPSTATYYFRHTLSEGIADSQSVWTGAGSGWLPVSGAFGLG